MEEVKEDVQPIAPQEEHIQEKADTEVVGETEEQDVPVQEVKIEEAQASPVELQEDNEKEEIPTNAELITEEEKKEVSVQDVTVQEVKIEEAQATVPASPVVVQDDKEKEETPTNSEHAAEVEKKEITAQEVKVEDAQVVVQEDKGKEEGHTKTEQVSEKSEAPVQEVKAEEINKETEATASSSSSTDVQTQKPLNITIMTSGSRGDVQPYCVIALALQNRGHHVKVATEERMHPFVESFGVPYAHVAGDPTAVLFTKEGQEMLNDGRIFRLMNDMKKFQEPTYEECLADYAKACEGADVIICGPLVMTQGYCLAEKNKAVWIPLILGPSFPTDEYPLSFISHSSFPFKFLNKITYSFTFWMLWKSESSQINKWRTKTLGLRPMSGGTLDVIEQQDCAVINAYTPHLIPGEKKPHDWGKKIIISGFLYPPAGLYKKK